MSVMLGGAPWLGSGVAHAPPLAHSHSESTISPRNNVEFSRELLYNVLEHLSIAIASEFAGTPIRLVAHGGACMLLHPILHELAIRKERYHLSRGENVPRRRTTRDVDYIHRSFVAEYESRGIINAGERLRKCIRATAQQLNLGADWMNSDADVALPMSTDPTTSAPFDPIYTASVKENNIRLYTVFTSSNRLLTIVNVTPFWAVALKLVRYAKWDPGDICLLLLLGSVTHKGHWTAEQLESWIRSNCSAMNYDYWDSVRLLDMKQKIGHAIALISSIGNSIMEQSPDLHLPNLKQFREHRTSNKIVQGNHAQSSAIHRSRSISQFAVPSAIGWAGPASDALAARLNSKAKHDSPQERHSTTWTAEPRDWKRGSRTNNEGLYLQEHRRRQSEYMLQADEPDDSDDTDSDSGCENGVEQIGCRHGSAPLIPMYTRPPSTATLLDDPTMVMYQWGSSSALFSTKKTEEPRPVTTVESSSCLAPNPTFIPDPRIQPQPHLPVFNSRTWSGVSHALPHHR